MIESVLSYMKARGGGIIHNISSGIGLTGFPGLYGYASTKGAIEALSRTLAMELEAYGIRVSLVHPPLTRTESAMPLGVPGEMMKDPSEVRRKLAEKIETRRAVITPDVPTATGLGFQRHFPGIMGRFLGEMTARARDNKEE
jgi:short-subunit dehydrogenase